MKTKSLYLATKKALQESAVGRWRSIDKCRLRRLLNVNLMAAIVAVASLAATPASLAGDHTEHWAGTWSAAPTTVEGPAQYTNQTLR